MVVTSTVLSLLVCALTSAVYPPRSVPQTVRGGQAQAPGAGARPRFGLRPGARGSIDGVALPGEHSWGGAVLVCGRQRAVTADAGPLVKGVVDETAAPTPAADHGHPTGRSGARGAGAPALRVRGSQRCGHGPRCRDVGGSLADARAHAARRDPPPLLTPAKVDAALGRLDGVVKDAVMEDRRAGPRDRRRPRGQGRVPERVRRPRTRASRGAIDADTVFQLASVSKPLAATVIAGVVGDGTVTWDSKTADLDPAFRLSGDYVSGEVTLRDLLCHRTGLPEHAGDLLEDLGLLPGRGAAPAAVPEAGRAVPVELRLHQLRVHGGRRRHGEGRGQDLGRPVPPTGSSSRSAWTGRATATPTTRPPPTGRGSTPASMASGSRSTIASPTPRPRPAGASSTVRDLARWMRLLLADGDFDGKPVIAADALGETHKPQVISEPAKKPTDRTGFYGLGWNVGHDPAGRLTLNHSGAFDLGAATCVMLVPAEKLGIVVLTNGAPIGVPEAVALTFLDIAQDGKPSVDWLGFFGKLFAQLDQQGRSKVDYSKPPAHPVPARPQSGLHRHLRQHVLRPPHRPRRRPRPGDAARTQAHRLPAAPLHRRRLQLPDPG